MLAFTIPPLLLPARESTIVICNCCCLLPSWFPLSLIWLEAWGSMIDIRMVCWGFPLLENSCFFGNSIVLSIPFSLICVGTWIIVRKRNFCDFLGTELDALFVGLMTWCKVLSISTPNLLWSWKIPTIICIYSLLGPHEPVCTTYQDFQILATTS